MKHGNIISFLFCFLAVIFSHSTAFAGSQGKAIVSFWQKSNNSTTVLDIVNISGSSVDVTVVFYDQTGAAYTESSESGTQFLYYWGFNGEDPVSSAATLATKEDGEIVIDKVGNTTGGFAIIYWTSSSNLPVALVATHRTVYYTGGADHGGVAMFPINQGQPF